MLAQDFASGLKRPQDGSSSNPVSGKTSSRLAVKDAVCSVSACSPVEAFHVADPNGGYLDEDTQWKEDNAVGKPAPLQELCVGPGDDRISRFGTGDGLQKYQPESGCSVSHDGMQRIRRQEWSRHGASAEPAGSGAAWRSVFKRRVPGGE
jgi:hypothetical protein